MRTRRPVRACGVSATWVLVLIGPVYAGTVYVATTGDDANDGQSWEKARRTVQAGLNAAVAGDEVWVAAGTYVERITLKADVALYGGFAGNEGEFSQRNIQANVTTLDGKGAGKVVTAPSGATATTRIDGFTIRNGRASSAGGIYCSYSSPTIANNTITANSAGNSGGGIYCYSSSPTIANNTIVGNSATEQGGGIWCFASSPVIANNTITGNSASEGGGIFCSIDSSPLIANTIVAFNSSGVFDANSGTLVLRHNCVYGNTSYNYSGITDPAGIDGNISADPRLASVAYGNVHIQPDSPCVDAGNNADALGDHDIDGQARIQPAGETVDIGSDESDGTTWRAGPYVIVRVSLNGDDANDGSSWALAKRTVQAGIDAASTLGGEVWVQGGTYHERINLRSYTYLYGGFAGTEHVVGERDWVTHRTTLDGQQAGSVVTVWAGRQSGRIDGFTIRNGRASSGGGGIACFASSPTITNNTITGNSAPSGGGISCSHSSPTIANNTITGNGVERSGGGILCSHSSPLITNNTITVNSASDGGGIECYYSSPTIANTIVAFNSSGICKNGSGTCTLRYNCVYGNTLYDYSGITDPTGSGGSISVDPRLASVAYGNVHIQPDSPCVDAGNIADAVSGHDMDGQSRTQPAGGTVDIGADESDGTVWPEGPHVIVRVSPDGDDANDGSSWTLAKRTVQAGIDAASNLGGEVWVQAGTYYERVNLDSYAYLYGGFAGTEDLLGARDWASHTTILDGQQGGSVVTAWAGYQSSRIDGVTIRNGQTSGKGGGIHCAGGSPTIANNMITANSTVGIAGNGGGGICCAGGFAAIVHNTITGNRAGSSNYGGGIYCRFASPTIASNTITGNSASDGGGIFCFYSSPTIANNTITGNGADNSGGGIFCSYSSLMIVNNTITGNSTGPSGNGGAIHCYYSWPTIANTIIAFNSSGVYKSDSGTLALRHNCVYGNTSYNYSGITDPRGTAGNMSADPRLAGAAYGNVHIQPDSPCVDAGNNADAWGVYDMDGQSRIQPTGETVDIGADESDGTTWPAGPYMIVRVSPDGDDANDGSSWALAKRTVQAGIDAASISGGEVWVQAGTYSERINLRSYSYLYGGFAGTESMLDERDWAAHATILDGQQAGSVVTVWARHRSGRIDGFTIRNGRASRDGGGIYCSSYSSLTIANNTITGNSTGSSGNGGGIYCDSSSPTIVSNTITGNIASSGGGGIRCYDSSATIVNNRITGNSAVNYGSSGGGILCSYSSPIIANNMITRNSTGNNGKGGGICCASSSPSSPPMITNNTITANGTGGSGAGGGIYCYYSAATITNNTITENSVSYGGGIYCSYSAATITNNTIMENSVSYGGGIYCYHSSPTIANNTVTGNSTGSSGNGGGIHCYYSSPTIANTIIAFNSSGIYNQESSSTLTLRYNCVYGNTSYDYSGITDPTGTNSNISADPLFVRNPGSGPDGEWGTDDDDAGNLRLRAGSACVDAGENASVPLDTADLDGDGDTAEPLPIDLAGQPRFVDHPGTPDTGAGTPPIVDMGAYEFFPTVVADFDHDGDVDSDDFEVFEACAAGPAVPPASNCGATDFDDDGDVDQSDFAVFQRCYSGDGNPADPSCAD